ncbi:MAG TPA: cupin domain-containing protein [Casimicrobiaceae bacterium]|nr:cupin domain-containing protein [Casimicrobiaceae bacterium]
MELSPVQRRIRDFYFKDALGAPPEITHVHRPSLVPEQQLFSIEHLRRHLNNPLLDLNYVNLFQAGKPVDLADAHLYKLVQKRKIEFVDRRVLQQHLERGAACVLEGLDILEPEINALATALDRGRAATFSNATAFFSQRGHEAYRGHVDTDDVLVIHCAGEKRWSLHRRQAPRRVNLADLEAPQMGPVEAEVIMRPGDVLYLRSFTPHRVETLSPCSLHVSFDLCDRQPSIEIALQMLLRHYDRDSSPRATPPLDDLDKLFRHSRTAQYAAEIAQAQAGEDAGNAEFRNLLAVNRITYLDRFVQAPRPAQPVPAAHDTRT